MTGSRYSFYRYVMVPLPALVLLAGRLVGDVAAALGRRIRPARAELAVAAALLVLLVPSMIRDWKLNRILARRDTRTMAREWIEERLPGGGQIAASDHGTPYGKPQLPPSYKWVPIEDPAALRAKGIEYVLADTLAARLLLARPDAGAARAARAGSDARVRRRSDRQPMVRRRCSTWRTRSTRRCSTPRACRVRVRASASGV